MGSLLIAEEREVYPSRPQTLALHLPRTLRLIASSGRMQTISTAVDSEIAYSEKIRALETDQL